MKYGRFRAGISFGSTLRLSRSFDILSYNEFHRMAQGVVSWPSHMPPIISADLGLLDSFHKAEHFPIAAWFNREKLADVFRAELASVVQRPY